MKYNYVPESAASDAVYDPWSIVRVAFPMPVVSSRESRMPEFPMPTPVLSLAELAREHSWDVITQYSRGQLPHATTGKPGVLKDLLTLRFGGHPMTDRQAYAIYSRAARGGDWTWSSVMIWGPDLPPFAGCSVTDLKAYLIMCASSSTEGLARWVNDLKAIAENGQLLAKRREAVRRQVFAALGAGETWDEILKIAWPIFTEPEVEKFVAARKNTDREGMR